MACSASGPRAPEREPPTLADIFLSDVHLRLDRPDRARRLARLVDRLDPADRLVIVGDLCDFWFVSRQARSGGDRCEGLRALAEFRRRGGELTILPGNHDAWLGAFYRETLGEGFAGIGLERRSGDLRILATHGHTIGGARAPWKGVMEGRAFLRGFAALPRPIAEGLGVLLDSTNSVGREAIDAKHLAIYRRHADTLADSIDLAVFGHIHVVRDDAEGRPRMVVLGNWHDRASYLRVDHAGAVMVVEED